MDSVALQKNCGANPEVLDEEGQSPRVVKEKSTDWVTNQKHPKKTDPGTQEEIPKIISQMNKENVAYPDTNRASVPSGLSISTQQFKMKIENVPTPIVLSEGSELGAQIKIVSGKELSVVEIQDKAANKLQTESSLVPDSENNTLMNNNVEYGVHNEGWSVGGSSLFELSIPPKGKNLENVAKPNPLEQEKLCFDKNSRKAGSPQGVMDTKNLICPNKGLNTDSEDPDHKELLAAVKSARKVIHDACSNTVQSAFVVASVSAEDAAYSLQSELKSAEALEQDLSVMIDAENNVMEDLVCQTEQLSLTSFNGERQENQLNESGSNESATTTNLANQSQNTSTLFGSFDTEGRPAVTRPYFQLLLSAIIVTDEDIPDSESSEPSQLATDNSLPVTTMHKGGGGMEPEVEPEVNDCAWTHGSLNDISDNGSRLYENQSIDYKILLELKSIGLHPDEEPCPARGGQREIVELRKELYQQAIKTKRQLCKLNDVVQEERVVERRKLEHLAMDKLCEIALKKLKGYGRAKGKVKESILAFVKRTNARYREFEDKGRSCFSEPPYAAELFKPQQRGEAEKNVRATVAPNTHIRGNRRKSEKSQRLAPDGDRVGVVALQDIAEHKPKASKRKKPEISGAGSASQRTVVARGRGRKKEKLTTSSVAKDSRFSAGNATGNRKRKRKMNQKTDLAAPVHGSDGAAINECGRVGEVEEQNPMENHPDVGSLLEGVEDYDSMGLDIPMDDLSNLDFPL